jgi:hypothetical protein
MECFLAMVSPVWSAINRRIPTKAKLVECTQRRYWKRGIGYGYDVYGYRSTMIPKTEPQSNIPMHFAFPQVAHLYFDQSLFRVFVTMHC